MNPAIVAFSLLLLVIGLVIALAVTFAIRGDKKHNDHNPNNPGGGSSELAPGGVASTAQRNGKGETPQRAPTEGLYYGKDSTITAPLPDRIEEMSRALQSTAGKNSTQQVTGAGGRIYFLCKNGLEKENLEWIEYCDALLRKLYNSVLKKYGPNDVYVSRMLTYLMDDKVSYIHPQDTQINDYSFTSVSLTPTKPGLFSHPFSMIAPWWQTIVPIVSPAEADDPEPLCSGKTKREARLPFSIFILLHEIAHGIAGLIGHNQFWIRALHWILHEAEDAKIWSLDDFLDTRADSTRSGVHTLGASQVLATTYHYTWFPYTAKDLKRILPVAAQQDNEGQQIVVWANPKYKKGLGCPIERNGFKDYACDALSPSDFNASAARRSGRRSRRSRSKGASRRTGSRASRGSSSKRSKSKTSKRSRKAKKTKAVNYDEFFTSRHHLPTQKHRK